MSVTRELMGCDMVVVLIVVDDGYKSEIVEQRKKVMMTRQNERKDDVQTNKLPVAQAVYMTRGKYP